MAGLSPSQRTLKAMREQGRIVDIVERFISQAGSFGIRKDFLGFVDMIALDPVDGIIAIQSCGQDFSGHVNKLLNERNENVYEWLKHGKCEIWAWRKTKYRLASGGYGKAMRWNPRVADVTLDEEGELQIIERK